MYYLTRPGSFCAKMYLVNNNAFSSAVEEANKFTAEAAIEKLQYWRGLYADVTIEPVACNLADQLDTRRLACLAAMLGYKEAGCVFGETLKQAPALPHGFTMRDAALAYIEALRASMVAADPEARQ